MPAQLSVGELGTVLGVWAHPDDEAYLTAGLMSEVRAAGQRCVVATATYGEKGTADPDRWPPLRLSAVRRIELAASLAAVGVHEHRWLGYSDGDCAGIDIDTGAAVVGRLIAEVKPGTIVTFGPDGMTGHPDHRAVSAWVGRAWRAAGRRARLLHATRTPQWHARWRALNERIGLWMSGPGPVTPCDDVAIEIRCGELEADRKLVALRAHASQTVRLIAELGEDDFRSWWQEETFVAAESPNGRLPMLESIEP